MIENELESKKEVLQEIMGLMTKLGYDKMKKPMSMKIEMESDEPEGMGPQSAKEANPIDVEKPFGSKDASAPEADDAEEWKKRLMARFGK